MKYSVLHIILFLLIELFLSSCSPKRIATSEIKTEQKMNRTEINSTPEFHETVNFWLDDAEYKFLTIVLRLNSTNRKILRGSALVSNDIHVGNDLWLEDDNCKKRALEVTEADMGDFVEIRGIFLIDDLESFSNKLKIVHQTGITQGNQGQTTLFMNSHVVELTTIEIKPLESTLPLANKHWYHLWRTKNPESRDKRFRIASSNEQCE